MKSFYAQFIEPGDVCFDIGANLGSRTKIFINLGAKPVVVEPHPLCALELRKKFEENHNVSLVQVGLSDHIGKEIFNVSSISDVSTFSEDFIKAYSGQKLVDWNEQITVDVTTLDQLIQQYGIPKFMKLDIEGYESKALMKLSHPIPFISFEYNARLLNLAFTSIDILSELAHYKFRFSPYESMKYSHDEWIDGAQMKELLRKIQSDILTGDVYAKLILES
ncbi:MAG: FkbM family methyltransferase [Salibacteraceae bacterium]